MSSTAANPFRTYPRTLAFLNKLGDTRPSDKKLLSAEADFDTAFGHSVYSGDFCGADAPAKFERYVIRLTDERLLAAVTAHKVMWKAERAAYATCLYLFRAADYKVYDHAVQNYRTHRMMQSVLVAEVERRIEAHKAAAKAFAKAVR